MNANIEKINVTDRYGLLTVGTKREEMKNYKDSLFYHPLKKFDQTDKNKNGVIEADELLSRIKKGKALLIGMGSCCTLIAAGFKGALPHVSKYYEIAAMLFGLGFGGFAAYASFSNAAKENKKIAILNEYIKQQEAEKSAEQ